MAFLGLRAWPVPLVGPIWCFVAGGAITYWQISKAQQALLKSPQYANDPKNPYAKHGAEH